MQGFGIGFFRLALIIGTGYLILMAYVSFKKAINSRNESDFVAGVVEVIFILVFLGIFCIL